MARGRRLRVTLVGASLRRERELPGFEQVRDFASAAYNLAIPTLKAAALGDPWLRDRVEVSLVDLPATASGLDSADDALEAVAATEPDLCGLSCQCWSARPLLELGQALAEERPEVFLLAGGPSAGPVAPDLLERFPSLDAVARGEGEDTFVALLRALLGDGAVDDVPGLCSRDPGGGPREGPRPRRPVDLAAHPSPYPAGLVAGSPSSMLVETSRGCRFRCRFCSWVAGPRRVRYAPVERVEADLRWALDRGIEHVSIADAAINYESSRLEALGRAVRRADPAGRLRFRYFVKAELLTAEQARLLEALPAEEVIVGVESLEARARRAAGKRPVDPARLEAAVDGLARVGPVTLSFVLGLPGDRPDGLVRSLDWATGLAARRPGRVHEICLFWLAVLPGSPLHAGRLEHRARTAEGGIPYLLESDETSADDLLVMARAAAERHYARPSLRLEWFHREYLASDAPREDRRTAVERLAADPREVVLVVGAAPDRLHPGGGGAGHSLSAAETKAYASDDPEVRSRYRIELAHLPCRLGTPVAGAARAAVELARELAPRLLVVAAAACEPERLPLGPLRAASPRSLVVVAEAACSAGAAEQVLARLPDADAVVVGEPEAPIRELLLRGCALEGAPGLACRVAGRVSVGPPAPALPDADAVPSPFQRGMVRRAEGAVAMRLARPGAGPGGRPMAHSEGRIRADLRWAVEERLEHVVWLDRPLAARRGALLALVAAARAADPEGRLAHSLAIGPEGLRPELLELLGRIRTGWILAPATEPVGEARAGLERLAERTGGTLVCETGSLDPAAVRSLLARWVERGRVAGWTLRRVGPDPDRPGAVLVELADPTGAGRLARLEARSDGLWPRVAVAVEGPLGAGRLEEVLGRWVESGERHLLGLTRPR